MFSVEFRVAYEILEKYLLSESVKKYVPGISSTLLQGGK